MDRCVGIALVALLRPFRRARAWRALRSDARIALLNTYGIGDTILISAIVADLKAAYPSARVVFFAGPSCSEAAALIPGVEVVAIPLLCPWRALRAIRREAFDLWIDCAPWPRINALLSFCARAGFTVGFDAPGQHRHYLYDRAARHGEVHEIENLRALLRVLGIPAGAAPALVAGKADRGSPYAVLHLHAGGSRARWKEWPDAHWVALMDALTADGTRVSLTGAARDRARCLAVRGRCRRPGQVEVVAGEMSLAQTAALLRGARCVVSVDTGVMHLAAALGCATIALHGATSPRRWGGVGRKVVSLEADARGPFLHHGFERIRPPDMAAIKVEHVLREVARARSRAE